MDGQKIEKERGKREGRRGPATEPQVLQMSRIGKMRKRGELWRQSGQWGGGKPERGWSWRPNEQSTMRREWSATGNIAEKSNMRTSKTDQRIW